MEFIKLYAIALLSFVVLDGLWIGALARGFYNKYLGFLFSAQPQWTPVVLFYLIYAAGLVYLVVLPNLSAPLGKVFLLGALVGLMAYGAYDFTNQATIKDWPWTVTLVDLAWGTFASGAVAAIATAVYKLLA